MWGIELDPLTQLLVPSYGGLWGLGLAAVPSAEASITMAGTPHLRRKCGPRVKCKVQQTQHGVLGSAEAAPGSQGRLPVLSTWAGRVRVAAQTAQ